jgi:hypothetical protein
MSGIFHSPEFYDESPASDMRTGRIYTPKPHKNVASTRVSGGNVSLDFVRYAFRGDGRRSCRHVSGRSLYTRSPGRAFRRVHELTKTEIHCARKVQANNRNIMTTDNGHCHRGRTVRTVLPDGGNEFMPAAEISGKAENETASRNQHRLFSQNLSRKGRASGSGRFRV